MSEATQRNTHEALTWGRVHNTTRELGYNPDGRCLQIAREMRNEPPMYPSAVIAQNATPTKYRVSDVSDFVQGMVIYYDDPNDENPYGHIVTMVGRVKGARKGDLSGILVRTNSVKSGRTVIVNGDYFPKYWGDKLQFAATWLNGSPLYDLQPQPKPKPKPVKRLKLQRLIDALDSMREGLQDMQMAREAWIRKGGNKRLVNALNRDIEVQKKSIAELEQTLRKFGRK